jgi:hypothetical protein
LQRYAPDGQFSGAVALHVDPAEAIAELGRIAHPQAQQSREPEAPEYYRPQLPIRRALVIGDRLFTLSDGGVLASDLGTLKDAGWAPFS